MDEANSIESGQLSVGDNNVDASGGASNSHDSDVEMSSAPAQ